MDFKSERLELCDQQAQELLDDARRRGLRAKKTTHYDDSPTYTQVKVYLPPVNLKGYTFDRMVLHVTYTRRHTPNINIFIKDERQFKLYYGGREPERTPGAKYSRHPHAGGGGCLCSSQWRSWAINNWRAGEGVDQLIPGAISVIATHTPRDTLHDLGGIKHCIECRGWLGDDPLYHPNRRLLSCHCGKCETGEPICSECAYVCKECEAVVSKGCRRTHALYCATGMGPDLEDKFQDQFTPYATWKQEQEKKELS